MTCPALDRGHCSCPSACCVGPGGECVCTDCECQAYTKHVCRNLDGPCLLCGPPKPSDLSVSA